MLYCSNNKITYLDNLPINLIKLHCSGTQITSLSNLPINITELNCHESVMMPIGKIFALNFNRIKFYYYTQITKLYNLLNDYIFF
jgi:hypothetical protein